jgi:hypothetical protein
MDDSTGKTTTNVGHCQFTDTSCIQLLFTTTLGAVDKVEIGTASLYGFQSDNHMTGEEYSWLGSILPLGVSDRYNTVAGSNTDSCTATGRVHYNNMACSPGSAWEALVYRVLALVYSHHPVSSLS